MSRVLGALLLLGLLLSVAARTAADAMLHDPTQPLRPPAATAPVESIKGQILELESVLIGARRSHAVINGQRITVGEQRSGVRVLEIHSDSVVVSVDGSPPRTLALAGAGIHKESR